MSNPPFISVIVPTRDRPALLADCLAKLRANAYRHREVIVVDQSCGDETAAMVWSAACLDRSIRYVRSDTSGSSRAQNVALRVACGELLAITNDDCRPAANWLGRIVEEFMVDREVVAVFGPFLPLRPPGGALSVAALTGRRRRVQHGMEEVWRLGYGGNMAFRRQAVTEAGGFDEMLGPGSPHGWGCNDVDLVYRVLRNGGTAVYVPDVVVWHVQQFGLSQALRREASYARGAGAIVAKLLRCGDQNAWRLLAQRLWPVGPGRTWGELAQSMAGGCWWAVGVRAMHRVYCLTILIPLGALAGCRQPLSDKGRLLYRGSGVHEKIRCPRSRS
ncbi:MAG: glycosyltransferase [Anaerolineae bacterium]|nr:glycosyltransferase [Anaerolineae bacterium]